MACSPHTVIFGSFSTVITHRLRGCQQALPHCTVLFNNARDTNWSCYLNSNTNQEQTLASCNPLSINHHHNGPHERTDHSVRRQRLDWNEIAQLNMIKTPPPPRRSAVVAEDISGGERGLAGTDWDAGIQHLVLNLNQDNTSVWL